MCKMINLGVQRQEEYSGWMRYMGMAAGWDGFGCSVHAGGTSAAHKGRNTHLLLYLHMFRDFKGWWGLVRNIQITEVFGT